MLAMEDSGFDSEEHLSTVFDNTQTLPGKPSTAAENVHKCVEDMEVAFRGTGLINSSFKDTSLIKSTQNVETQQPMVRTQSANSCRILQRKLELKVERAKRNFSQYQEEQSKKTQSANLIPINRLAIPGDVEPLVDYKSDDSAEPEEISFFPARLKHARKQGKQELTDTFSIQEMTIDSDLESNDSYEDGNLELLPPRFGTNMLDKLKSCFGCMYKK